MSATKVMVAAMLLGVVGRWANNQKAVPPAPGLIEVLFALGLIAFLDQGRTEPVAKGFAWLFFASVLLSDNSPLTGLARIQARTLGGQAGTAAGAAAASAGRAAGSGGGGGRTVAAR
jgi:hypothetical protein